MNTTSINSIKFSGYGEEGRPPQIPGKSNLYFDITLEKLIKANEEL